MVKRVRFLVTGLALIAWLSVVAGGASGKPTQKPIRVQPGTSLSQVPAPKALAQHGISFVSVKIETPPVFSLTFLNSQGEVVATFSVNEEVATGRGTYSLQRPNGSKTSLTVERTRSQTAMTSRAQTSDGAMFTVEAQLGSVGTGGKVAVTGIRAYDGRQWTSYDLATAKQEARQKSHGALWAQEAAILYGTNDAQLLRDLLLATPEAVRSSMSAKVVTPLDCAECEYENRPCKSTCFRQTTLAPLYLCDDGYWDGCYCGWSSGWWLIGDCGFSLVCSQDCCAFTICG